MVHSHAHRADRDFSYDVDLGKVSAVAEYVIYILYMYIMYTLYIIITEYIICNI